MLRSEDVRVVLEERVGPVVCVTRHRRGEPMGAYFHLPKLPERVGEAPDNASLAADLGVEAGEIGFDAHKPTIYGVGPQYLFAPLKTLKAVASLQADRKMWGADGGASVFAYTREHVDDDVDFHARMFAGGWGVPEDPATGSAVAAFAGVLMAFEPPGDGEHMLAIEQGFEMGRPSKISLGMKVEGGKLVDATIGGYARIVCDGTIDV